MNENRNIATRTLILFLVATVAAIAGLAFYGFPTLYPYWVLVGGALIFISAVLVIFGHLLQLSVWGTLFALPVFSYEMFLAIWLIVKGFNSEVIDGIEIYK